MKNKAFINKCGHLEPNLIASAELLGEIADDLDQAEDHFEELDEDMTGVLNG